MVKEDPFEKLLKRDLVSRTTYLIMNVKSLIVSFMSTDRYRHRVARLGEKSVPIWQHCILPAFKVSDGNDCEGLAGNTNTNTTPNKRAPGDHASRSRGPAERSRVSRSSLRVNALLLLGEEVFVSSRCSKHHLGFPSKTSNEKTLKSER